jgi:hypothetical protein
MVELMKTGQKDSLISVLEDRERKHYILEQCKCCRLAVKYIFP